MHHLLPLSNSCSFLVAWYIAQTCMCLRFCSMPSQHLVISRIVSALDIRSLQQTCHLRVPCESQQ